MLTILLGAALITALLNAFLFGGGFVLSIAVAALAALGIGLSLIPAVPAKARSIIRIAVSVCVIALCLFVAPRTEENGFVRSQTAIANAYDKIAEEDGYAADKIMDEMNYGGQEPAEATLVRADAEYMKGEYEKALSILDRMNARDKHLPKYYLLAAGTNLDLGRADKSEKLLVEAAQLYPEWLSVQYYAGTVALQNGNLEKATFFLARALDLCEDDNEYVLCMLGTAYYKSGDYETAKEYLDMALASATDQDIITEINAMLSDISGKEAAK